VRSGGRHPGYKQRLWFDGRAATQQLDIPVTKARIIGVKNTAQVHHLITCTLCCCDLRPPQGAETFALSDLATMIPRDQLIGRARDAG
jgi:hypothetical protein